MTIIFNLTHYGSPHTFYDQELNAVPFPDKSDGSQRLLTATVAVTSPTPVEQSEGHANGGGMQIYCYIAHV